RPIEPETPELDQTPLTATPIPYSLLNFKISNEEATMPFSAVIAEAFIPYDRVAPIRSTISVSGLISGYATNPSGPASGCCGSYRISGALESLITPASPTPPGTPFAAVKPSLEAPLKPDVLNPDAKALFSPFP